LIVAGIQNTAVSTTNKSLEIVVKRLLAASDVRETEKPAAIREGSGTRESNG
jgi:hypothetical protein